LSTKRPKCVVLSEKDSSAKRYGRTLAARSPSTTWLLSITLFVPEITAGWWATTTATVIIIGISPAPTRNLLFISYERLLERFLAEVRELRQEKEPI